MRFGALSAFAVLGASLSVSASPIRVVVTEVSSVRYGHAAADGSNQLAHISHPSVDTLFAASAFAQPVPILPVQNNNDEEPHSAGRRLCKSMRAKALNASNALRQWLGLEPIRLELPTHRRPHSPFIGVVGPAKGVVPEPPMATPTDGRKNNHGLPMLPFVGTPVRPAAFAEGEGGWVDRQGRRPMWINRHGYGHHHLRGSFLRRVHHALITLGPWEGRAVAFVLGCGIGVLLRMVWVMVLVTARAFRGSRSDESEYAVVFDEAEAEMLVPPPQYTVIEGSEAVPVPADEKADKDKDKNASA